MLQHKAHYRLPRNLSIGPDSESRPPKIPGDSDDRDSNRGLARAFKLAEPVRGSKLHRRAGATPGWICCGPCLQEYHGRARRDALALALRAWSGWASGQPFAIAAALDLRDPSPPSPGARGRASRPARRPGPARPGPPAVRPGVRIGPAPADRRRRYTRTRTDIGAPRTCTAGESQRGVRPGTGLSESAYQSLHTAGLDDPDRP
jgi:hypothetical protein